MSVIGLARGIAFEAHEGQEYAIDGVGLPYFRAHLEPVANIILCLGYDDKTIAAGFLHDVVEDTDTTLEDLADQGIPDDVIIPIDALTHYEGQSDEDYLHGISLVPRAIVGKFADSSYNLGMTLSQQHLMSPERYQKLRTRYERNLGFLRPILPNIIMLEG